MNISQVLTKLKALIYSKSETDSLLGGKANSSHTHTKSQITDFPSLATVATSGSYSDLSNKPSSMTPSSHSHGNITNAGAIGTTANKPLITTTNGAITTGSFGTTANTFCQGNDSRLSDARTPTSHTHTKSQITDFPTIPSKTSQLTNDSGFLTSHQSLSNYSTLANTIKSLSISGKTITYTKGDNTTGTLTTQDNNTWTAMKGATSSANGSVGYVNAVPPKDGYNTKYLRADGTWQVPPDHTYTVNNATLTIQKNGTTVKTFTANASSNVTCNITVPTKVSELTNDSGFLTSHQSLSSRVPVAGGAVITGESLGRTVNNGGLRICGGTAWNNGASINMSGKDATNGGNMAFYVTNGRSARQMTLFYDGGWTWNGTAVQITSDQRLKQQIAEIDDKLLDAWEDVDLVQFKYNDAVDQKGDTARLHTGYVVQQIDEACKSHNLDISAYGLYCHEEYPEETEEVEVEQEDGTIKKETKVIREASEHYSLRYTETLVVECAFLRREVRRLSERLSKLEQPSTSEK